MTTTITAADAAEFLSLVPHLLGFAPTQSLVIVPFADGRSAGGIRIDLPAADRTDLDAVAATTIGLACRVSAVDAVAILVYCDEEWGDRPPHATLTGALRRRVDASGLRLVDALVVTANAWGSLLDPALPAGGKPLTDIIAREFDGAATPVHAHAAGAELPTASLADRDRVGRALGQLDRARHVLEGIGVGSDERIDPRAFVALCTLDDIPAFFEGLLSGAEDATDPDTCAMLIWVLDRPALRDVGLATWVRGLDAGDVALEAQLRWQDGAEYPAAQAEWFMGEGRRPDAERLVAALEIVRSAAAVAPRASRAGVLAVCGWLAWALGRSTHADTYARGATEIEPEHGLACILRSMVAAGYLPDWAFRGGAT